MPETWSDEPMDQLCALAREGGRAAQGLPGAEVRALGARRRRRRAVATAGAVVMAMVVVAGGAFAALDRLGGTPVRPADPSPTRPVDSSPTEPADPAPTEPAGPSPTVIPSDYPIDRDLPDLGSDGTVEGPGADVVPEPFALCHTTVLPGSVEPIDKLGVGVYEAGFLHARAVWLYDDAKEAEAVLQGMDDAVADCPMEDLGERVVRKYEVESTALGDRGVMVLTSHEGEWASAIGPEQLHVVRVSSAVLVVSERNANVYNLASSEGTAWIDEVTDVARSLAEDLRACLEGTSCSAP